MIFNLVQIPSATFDDDPLKELEITMKSIMDDRNKLLRENNQLKEEYLMYKTAADEEAGFVDRLQQENRKLQEELDQINSIAGPDD